MIELGELYVEQRNAAALSQLIRSEREFMTSIAKSKTSKLIRRLLSLFSNIPGAQTVQIDATKEAIDWATKQKLVFLKQSLEAKLIELYLDAGSYRDALALINSLLRELKKLDDKHILTEVHLLESRANYALSNLPKAKAALTSARTAANAIYIPQELQARLDLQSGILHAEDKDYNTGYSYFFEAVEALSVQSDPDAVPALKYMLLCKIMLSLPEDVASIIQGKLAHRYAGRDVDAMKAVAKAHEDRSLANFEKALQDYKKELSEDPIIRNHLSALYDTLLEQNLVRIIEPYNRVELAFIAQQVKLPLINVEAKLSQMILDKIFHGILDQGAGCLIVYDEPEEDKTYDATLETLKSVGSVVDALYAKVSLRGP